MRDIEVVSTVDVRSKLSALLNQVAFGKQRIVITRRGEELVVIVPLEDLKLLERIEEHLDLAEAESRLAEETPVAYKEVRKKLGLS